MKTLLLAALLALAALPLVPASAADEGCTGDPERVALCQSGCCGRDCFEVHALGGSVHRSCLGPSAPRDAAAEATCLGKEHLVAVCERAEPGRNCFDAYVLGNNVFNPCLTA